VDHIPVMCCNLRYFTSLTNMNQTKV